MQIFGEPATGSEPTDLNPGLLSGPNTKQEGCSKCLGPLENTWKK